VRKPTAKRTTSVSPNPKVYGSPVALKREKTSNAQKNFSEGTLLYGTDDNLPLRIAKAVEDSPAASSCVDRWGKFIKGGGFSKRELEDILIDDKGTTLWSLHCALAETLATFWGFSVNFKYNGETKPRITCAHSMGFESVRFIKPEDDLNDDITQVIYNPYIGTNLYQQKYTTRYNLFDLDRVRDDQKALKEEYPGQVYYFGKTTPIHRFYPVPRYWSAKHHIEVDNLIQEFNAKELKNGFFQSVLINVIGNPNDWSTNPEHMVKETLEDGTIEYKPTITQGQEFDTQMSEQFSGAEKAGTAMVLWSLNADSTVKVTAFPSTVTADRLIAVQDITTKEITIAFQTPSILANISEGVSLGSGGSEIQKAVELMQSNTAEFRKILEDFYNNILLPNLVNPVLDKVEIVNYTPVSVPVEINELVWEFLNEQERIAFIRKNMPGIEIIRTELAAPLPGAAPAQPAQELNSVLANLTGRQMEGIQRIVRKFNKEQLTFEQAKDMLKSGFGFSDEQVNTWLITPEEE
jgi:YHS domain-containing protein